MSDGICAGLFCDLNKAFGDQRPRDGGAQQIEPFIDRIGAEHWEDEVAHELFADVFDIDRGCAHHLGFGTGGFQLFPLAQIGGEGHNLATIFGLQPFQDDGGIKTTGIGEHNFLWRGHEIPFLNWARGSWFCGFGQDRRVDGAGVRAYERGMQSEAQV